MGTNVRSLLFVAFAMAWFATAPGRADHVGIDMRNVHLHVAADATLDISWLHGTLRPTAAGQTPVFDDPTSFEMAIEDAALSIDAASLTTLVNRAFSFKGSNLSDLRVSFEGPLLVQQGKLSKGVTVPFTVKASVSVTPDGLLRVHPEKTKTAGVPTAGLMHLFGIELDNLVHANPAGGIRIEGNDLLLDPGRLLPAPATTGHLASAHVRDNHLVQIFGRGAARRPKGGGNYIWFRGGTIRFGKLTMSDADLQLIDMQPGDPFDFYSANYNAQLVAGYSKNTPQHGLRTYMPDYRRVGR
jgi:hypothetical protein